jgi:ABC-type dipeptide/oligopeptide/nickel transport system ATPase component
MAESIAIVGASGSGKSTSLRNLDPKSTFIINVTGKSLPFPSFKKNYTLFKQDPETKKFVGNLYNTSDVKKIAQALKIIDKTRPDIKVVVLEDAQYLMGFEMMDRANEKGYDKFSQISANFYSVLKEIMNMRDDLKVCVITHSENIGDSTNPSYKIKTVGKMLDTFITIEGLFTYVLFTEVIRTEDANGKKIEYKFITNSDGTTTAKTPMGCFEDLYIDNDLKYVLEKIDEYNNG